MVKVTVTNLSDKKNRVEVRFHPPKPTACGIIHCLYCCQCFYCVGNRRLLTDYDS